jgi:hypothetical protein
MSCLQPVRPHLLFTAAHGLQRFASHCGQSRPRTNRFPKSIAVDMPVRAICMRLGAPAAGGPDSPIAHAHPDRVFAAKHPRFKQFAGLAQSTRRRRSGAGMTCWRRHKPLDRTLF